MFLVDSVKTYPFTKETIDNLFREKKTYFSLETFKSIDLEKVQKAIKISTIIAIALLLTTQTAYAAGASDKLWSLWLQLLKATRTASYIVFVYKSIETVIKAAIEENIQACWKKVLGYIIGFAVVKYLPDVFDAIDKQ